MSLLKSLLLTLLIVLCITCMLDIGVFDLSNIQVIINNQQLEPLSTIILSVLAAMVLIIAGLAFIMSFIGGLLFITLLVCCSVFLGLLGLFWPLVLVAVVIWLCCPKKAAHCS